MVAEILHRLEPGLHCVTTGYSLHTELPGPAINTTNMDFTDKNIKVQNYQLAFVYTCTILCTTLLGFRKGISMGIRNLICSHPLKE